MPESLFLPINILSNRILNADEISAKRRIDLILTRIVAASSELTGDFSYVSSLNGAEGDLTLTAAGSVSILQAGSTFTISGQNPDLSIYATTAALGATGAALQSQITNLENQTGSFYPRTNPSGFLTGIDLSSYATLSDLETVETNLDAEIAILSQATGSYYPHSNPSGFITSAALSPYATTIDLNATGEV